MARILLIDDDEPLRTLLRLLLTHCGHAVIEARNGKEGLELFQQTTVDLLITDLRMPEKEGLEVVLALRERHPSVKIIAIAGGGRAGARDNLHIAKVMGAAKVLAKPFSNEALMTAVNELLPGSAATMHSRPPK